MDSGNEVMRHTNCLVLCVFRISVLVAVDRAADTDADDADELLDSAACIAERVELTVDRRQVMLLIGYATCICN